MVVNGTQRNCRGRSRRGRHGAGPRGTFRSQKALRWHGAEIVLAELLHRAHSRRLPRGLRPDDPQLDQARRAAQLQARCSSSDRPGRCRCLPRPPQRRGVMRRDTPVKRRNPSGQVVWVARYTGRDGRRHIAKPSWNRGKGTFARKGEAQKAIDEAYGLSDRPDTLGDYFSTWTERHPRSERTNATNEHRISRVTNVAIEGIRLKDWPLRELRRRHALAVVDHMLRVEGRATTEAVGIIRSLSAMTEDAITDEVCDLNPFKGVRIRANDPRAKKKPRPIR